MHSLMLPCNEEAKHVEPTFVGPASMKTPDAAEQGEVEAEAETSCAVGDSADATCENHGSVTADDSIAENLIGLDEGHIADPCARFSVLQRKLEVFHKETLKLQQKEAQQEAAEGDRQLQLQTAIEGQREHCKQVALDVRELAKRMGPKYGREIEQAASEAARHIAFRLLDPS